MFGFKPKQLKQNADEIDFTEFDDFDFDEFDQEPNNREVSITSRLKREVGDEIRFKYQDAKFRRDVLRNALPSDYTPALESYDAVSNELGKFYRDQQKEWQKVRRDVKSVVKPFGDVAAKLGFKKLKDWAEEPEREERADIGEDELDEIKIQSMLQETFGQYAQQQTALAATKQEIDDERYAEDRADKEINQKQVGHSNTLLDSINVNTAANRSFNEQVTYSFQRRSIEIQARLLITQQRSLQIQNSYRKESMEELQAIHKNTGLPDYLKITSTEIAQQQLTQKLMSGILAPFDGTGSKLTNRVLGKIRGRMTNLWQFLGEGARAISDSNRDTTDAGGSVLSSYGDMLRSTLLGSVVDKGATKLSGFITPKIRAELERRGLDVYGSNISSILAQMPTLANKGLKQGFGNNFVDGIVDFLGIRDAAITGERTAFSRESLDLEKAAFLDNRMKLAIVDIIPNWLKKIYENTFKTAFRKQAPNLTWDHHKGTFVDVRETENQMMDSIVKKENLISSVDAVDEWLRVLDPHGMMSAGTRKWVKRWVLKERAGSDAMHPLELLAPNVSAPSQVKGELLFLIPKLLKLTDKQQEEIMNADGVTDILKMSLRGNRDYNATMRELSSASAKIRKTSTLDEKEIEKIAQTAQGRQSLIKMGILIPGADGVTLFVNPEFERRAFDLYSKDYKRNGRLNYDEDGRVEVEAVDEDYDASQEKNRLRSRLKFGSLHHSDAMKEHEEGKRRVAMHRRLGDLDTGELVVGDGYIITPNGDYYSNQDGNYQKVLKRYQKTRFSPLSMVNFNPVSPNMGTPFRRRFAAGGTIPSFAKGGTLKPGETQGQPDQEQVVKTHGGEYVVSKDATDFNKQLLDQINKLGAPLINADNTINSAYYKLFGFKSEKEFKNGAKLKGLTSKAKEYSNSLQEDGVQKIWQNIDLSQLSEAEIRSVLDQKLSAQRRLTNAMKLWSRQEQSKAKADPKAYASQLSKMGIQSLHQKFNKFIDPRNEGTNIEILRQLGAIGQKVSGDVKDTTRQLGRNTLNFGRDQWRNARSNMLDRDRTLMAVSQTLKEVENPKTFTLPIDLYLKGRGTPFVTKAGFKNHEYIDQATGAIIKNPSEITGTIVDKDGSVIISMADLSSNQVVTRAQKPYRLMGLETNNRRYQSATEYAGNRYALIAQSEKFQDMVEKGKQARDKYLLDKPVDVYSRGKQLLLTAQGFKDRRYVDQNTGNVLWSHHDITGPVLDTQDNNNIVLTQEQLTDGLFDGAQVQLKISKIKQYRNMAFKRTGETYQKYASKHVNKVRDKLLNGMSAMGERRVGLNYDKNPIDIYVVGETEPRVTAAQFRAGKVFCKDAPIQSHSGIDGSVMMQNENGFYVQISTEELGQLCDAMGNKLELPLMMSATARFGAYLKEAFLPSKKAKGLLNFLKLSGDKRQELLDDEIKKLNIAYDVYIKGTPEKPALSKRGFENNQYVSQKTGKFIILPEYIDGPVLDTSGQMLISEEDLKKGLIDFNGRAVRIQSDGFMDSILRKSSIAKRYAKAKKEMLETTLEDIRIRGHKDVLIKAIDIKAGRYFRADTGKVVKDYADILAGVKDSNGNTVVSEADLKVGLETTSGKSLATLAKVKGALKSFTNLFRKGSWAQQREDAQKNKKDKEGKKEEKKEKKESWIGKLVKAMMSPVGVLFGGLGVALGGIKTALLGSISWLGKTLAARLAGAAIGGALAGGGRAGGRGVVGTMLGTAGGRLATAGLAYGAYQGYKYLDGDNSPQAIEQQMNDPKGVPASEPSFLEKAGTFAKDNALTLASLALLANPKQMAKGAWNLAKGGTKLFGRGVDAVARGGIRGAAWGAGKLAGRIPGMARLAGGAASLAGRAAVGSWGATGALGSAALNLGKILFTGVRLLTPWGLAATAAVGAYYIGKRLWNNHKNPWNRFRLAQYGFNHNDSETMERIAKIESIAQSFISVAGNKVSFKYDEKAMDEILKVCGFKDEEGKDIEAEQKRLPAFSIWFKERFLRVFGSYIQELKKIAGKSEMIDLQTLTREQQEKLLKGVHFLNATDSPYAIQHSPFASPKTCDYDVSDVDKLSRKLRDKISQLPKGQEPKFKPKATDDGLDKPLKANAAGKSETDQAVEKQMNAEGVVKQAKADLGDANTITDQTARQVKYNSVTTQAIAKAHQDAMIKTTEQAAKKTDTIFDRLWSSFSEKIKSFQDQAKSVMGAIKDGDYGDAVKNTADMVNNAVGSIPGVGGVLGAVGQYATNKVYDLFKGDAKKLQLKVYNAFLKAGLSPAQAKAITAEVGRENDYNAATVFGTHIDPAKRGGAAVQNVGMLSWNGARGQQLLNLLRNRKLVDGNGKMVQSQEALDTQAQFAVSEMKGKYAKALSHFWSNPNADPESYAKELGKNYVVWAYGQNDINAGGGQRKAFDWQKHDAKRRNFLQMLNRSVGTQANTPATTAASPAKTPVGTPPPGIALPSATAVKAGGMMANSMATLESKYGQKSTPAPATPAPSGLPAPPTALAKPKAPAVQANTAKTTAVASGIADYDLDKIASTVTARAKPASQGQCATYVRAAIQSGDLKKQVPSGLGHAYQFADNLPKIGFTPLGDINSVRPIKGDICVFPRYGAQGSSGSKYGHVCIFNGSQWVSDFVQSTMYPNRNATGIPHTIFRASSGVSKNGVVQAKSVGVEEGGSQPLSSANRVQLNSRRSNTATTNVNDKMEKINQGNTTTSTPMATPTPQPTPVDFNMSTTNDILNKQLSVQEKMLIALEKIAREVSGGGLSRTEGQSSLTTPTLNGNQKSGTPSVPSGQSGFQGISNPISVRKPS